MQSFSEATPSARPERRAPRGSTTRFGPNGPVADPLRDTVEAPTGPQHAAAGPIPQACVEGRVAPSADPEREKDNQRWTTALTQCGPARERSADALYTYLLRAARSEVARRAETSGLLGPERDDLAHQAAADALVSIIRRLPDFRGDSMFTTWARSFVTFEVRVKLRQHNRRSRSQGGMSTEELERLPSPRTNTPEAQAEGVELKQAVMSAIATSLTERQRHVFLGVVVHGASIEQLAAQLGSNRNAIYQLMFHARRNLRRHLAERGLAQGVPSV